MVNIRGAVERVMVNPKGEVGEIDTRAPIKSVKAAVSLYVEAVSKDQDSNSTTLPIKKSKLDFENVINKEAKLLLLRKAVENYKQLSLNDHKTIARAHSELSNAKKTLNELLFKLKTAKDSKLMAIEAAQFVQKQAKELEVSKSQHNLFQTNPNDRDQELDQEKEQYSLVVNLLDVSKQELTRIRQDFEAARESKAAFMQKAEEAQFLLSMNEEKIDEMSKEIRDLNESNQELTVSLAQIQEQIMDILRQKKSNAKACKKKNKKLEKKLDSLRQECDKLNRDELEAKLEETNMEIRDLQEKIRREKAFEIDSVTLVTAELNEATKTLQRLVEEEDSLRGAVASIRLELENVKNEKDKLQKQQQQGEDDESDMEEEVIGLCKEHRLMHKQLSKKTERKRKEIAEIKQTVDKLKKEAENAKEVVAEIKAKLEVALKNAEAAKSTKSKVYNDLTEKETDSPNNKSIKISVQEYEDLKKRLEESENLAQRKEEEARAQIEVINVGKNETEEKLNEQLQSIDEIDQAIEIAVKSAQTAESAQNAIQAELTRLQQAEEQAEQEKPSQNQKRYLSLSLPKYDTWKSRFSLSRLWQLKGAKFFKLR